ncbi:MAG TPA: hypothetical protein VH370_17095 [Humisphaera sp.]|nr:hypothetical protein [Humisphaera sp.]
METDPLNQTDLSAPALPEPREPAGASGNTGAPAARFSPAAVEQFVGIIRGGPCAGAGADYTDARYYIDRAIVGASAQPGDLLSATSDTFPGVKQCLTATNLAELADNSHSLSPGTIVQVFSIYARGGGNSKLHVFSQPSRSLGVVVRIDSNAAGAGEYNGAILTGSSDAAAGSDLVMPAGMDDGAADALILNAEEDSETGHRLASGTYAVGVTRGMIDESPARKIVVIRGGVGRMDSPTTLGDTSEGSETADTSNWSRASTATPLNLYVVSRMVYNESGDQTLYQFVRQLSLDARGLLVSVSGETRVTIDVTEPCP